MRIIEPCDYRCHPWRGSSPWGQVQRAAEIAPGLHQVSTAGHGGVWLSSSRVAALTKAFPGFVPFAGWPWLEEDCDACLAVLAWPELFPAAAVREAVRMVHVMADWKHCANKWGAVRDQIRPDVIDIADAEEKRLIDADASLTTTRKGNDMSRKSSSNVTTPAEQIRYSNDGSICMVWSGGEPVRCPTQDDMDRLPVGPDMTEDDVALLDS